MPFLLFSDEPNTLYGQVINCLYIEPTEKLKLSFLLDYGASVKPECSSCTLNLSVNQNSTKILPCCGFVRVQRILIFVARIAIQHIKGAGHRNIICKEIKRIVAKTLHVEKLNIIHIEFNELVVFQRTLLNFYFAGVVLLNCDILSLIYSRVDHFYFKFA